MQSVLSALKDIPGVVGSFVLSPQGALVAREMPTIFPDTIFPNLGRRLASVVEALETQMSAVQDLVLKFEGHWLLIRRSAQGFLTILTNETVNFPALKMASNVALKQVAEHLVAHPDLLVEQPSVIAEPTPDQTAPAPTPAAEASPEPAKKRRMWRGQWVD